MNHQVRLALDAHILGDGCLQDRLSAYIEILGYLMSRCPRPAGVEQLEGISGRRSAALKRCCQELAGAGILKRSLGPQRTWHLAKCAGEITLEDVFRCAVDALARRRATTSRLVSAGDDDTEVLLMQALQTVDDHLYKNLRTYSFDRFIASRAASFPGLRRHAVPAFAEIDE